MRGGGAMQGRGRVSKRYIFSKRCLVGQGAPPHCRPQELKKRWLRMSVRGKQLPI